jgi:ribonucleoside-diphosphate reductase beta chain
MKTVFNLEKVDATKQPMFFGEGLNMQRYDVFKYPVFDKLNETMTSFFWRPQEVSLQKDRSDFALFRPEQKFIFTKNLASQIVMDSIQGRSPTAVLMPYVSLPELEGCMNTWQYFEQIHSRSYTHILKNVYPNPAEVFDNDVMDDQMIVDRAEVMSRYYDDFFNIANNYFIKGEGSLFNVKKKLVLAIYAANALEGLRFYVSFACTFAFAEQKLVEGSAKIISLIARDESQHLSITQHIVKNWLRGDDPEILEILNLVEVKQECLEIYLETVFGEKEWGKYLFSNGSIIGLNNRLTDLYVDYLAGRRMKAIGIEYPGPKVKENPLPWTNHWLSSSSLQVAPQEAEIESYLVGAINPDINVENLRGYVL